MRDTIIALIVMLTLDAGMIACGVTVMLEVLHDEKTVSRN